MNPRLLELYNQELHTGSYFGWTGRIILTLSSLMMPLFAPPESTTQNLSLATKKSFRTLFNNCILYSIQILLGTLVPRPNFPMRHHIFVVLLKNGLPLMLTTRCNC